MNWHRYKVHIYLWFGIFDQPELAAHRNVLMYSPLHCGCGSHTINIDVYIAMYVCVCIYMKPMSYQVVHSGYKLGYEIHNKYYLI